MGTSFIINPKRWKFVGLVALGFFLIAAGNIVVDLGDYGRFMFMLVGSFLVLIGMIVGVMVMNKHFPNHVLTRWSPLIFVIIGIFLTAIDFDLKYGLANIGLFLFPIAVVHGIVLMIKHTPRFELPSFFAIVLGVIILVVMFVEIL